MKRAIIYILGALTVGMMTSCASTSKWPHTDYPDAKVEIPNAEEERRLEAKAKEEKRSKADIEQERYRLEAEATSRRVDEMIAKERARRDKELAQKAKQRKKEIAKEYSERQERKRESIQRWNSMGGGCGDKLKNAIDTHGDYEDSRISRSSDYLSVWYYWPSMGYTLNLTAASYRECEWFESFG